MSIVYFLLCCLCFVRNKLSWPLIVVIILILCLIATYRDPFLPDYESYYNFRVHYVNDERLEPSTFLIRDISIFLSNSFYLFFFIYALIAITLKLVAIHRLTNYVVLSLLAYLALDFPIHEMIQMRVAVAMGFMLLSLPYIYEKKIVQFIFIVALATTFHYTALLALPLYFINVENINKRREIFLLLLSFLVGLLKTGITFIIGYIPIDFVQYLYNMYKQTDIFSNEESIFSIMIMCLFVIQMFLLWNVEKISTTNKYIFLLIKIQTISLCSFFLLNDMPTIAGRVSEFYRIAFIISIPLIVPLFKQNIIGKFLTVIICTVFYFRLLSLYYI